MSEKVLTADFVLEFACSWLFQTSLQPILHEKIILCDILRDFNGRQNSFNYFMSEV